VLSSSTDPAVLTATTSGVAPAADPDAAALEYGLNVPDGEDVDPVAAGGPPVPGWLRLA